MSEFVDMLCQCFSVVSKDSIEKWGTEALDWARSYRVCSHKSPLSSFMLIIMSILLLYILFCFILLHY